MWLMLQSSPWDQTETIPYLTKSTSLLSPLHPFHCAFFLKSSPSVNYTHMGPYLRLCSEPDPYILWVDCLSFFTSLVFQIFINPFLCLRHLLLCSRTSGSCGETISTQFNYLFGSQSLFGDLYTQLQKNLIFCLVNEFHNSAKIGIKQNFHAF